MSNCVVSSFKADRSTTGCFCEVVRDEQETTLDVCVCVCPINMYPLVIKHSYGKSPFIVDFPIEHGDFL